MPLDPLDTINIPQNHTPEATLVIWENREGPRILVHPGHAALLLRRYTFTDLRAPWDPTRVRYVSFFPGGDREKKSMARAGYFSQHYFWDMKFEMSDSTRTLLRSKKSPRRRGQYVIEYYDDEEGNPNEMYGQMADGIISLQAMTASNRYQWGIDLNRIVAWAIGFRASRDFNYEFISTTGNCAGVAIRALRAGGGEAFASLIGGTPEHTIYVTPKNCIEIGTTVAMGIRRANFMMNHMSQIVQAKFAGVGGTPATRDISDLYRATDWKSDSAVAYKIRGNILRGIDSALEQYHRFSWDTAYPEKLQAYLSVLKGTFEHFQVSQSGRREPAFVVLAMQLLQVWTMRAAEVDNAWNPNSYYGQRDPFTSKAQKKKG